MKERPTMIKQTRKQLAAWFVSGIMLISVLLSILLFWTVDHQLQADYLRAQRRLEIQQEVDTLGLGPGRGLHNSLPWIDSGLSESNLFIEELIEFRTNFLIRLAQFNLVVLILSAVTGYWLAGLALQPLAAALERERQFSSDVSHELKTPLAALKTSLEVSMADRSLGKNIKLLLADNLQDVDHLEVIVKQLLTLAQTGRAAAEGSTSVKSVLQKVHKIYLKLAKKKGVVLLLPKKIVSANVRGSQSQLVELLGILTDNAIKFTPRGGKVEFGVKCKRGKIDVSIIDNGPGIEPDSLPHIFDRFVKGSRSRTRTHNSGLGLGLSIAKQMVEQLGGEIYVRTTPGKGSEFTVSLVR